ncbi:MAG: phage major capsid protein [Bacteroidales bacterium]
MRKKPEGLTVQEFIRQLKEEKDNYMEELRTLSELDSMDAEQEQRFDKLNADVENLSSDIAELETKAKRDASVQKIRQSVSGTREVKSGDEKDLSSFRFTKFLREAVAQMKGEGKLTGIEAEMAQEAQREARKIGEEIKGYGVPSILLNAGRRSVVAGTNEQGGYLVQDEPLSYLEALRDRLVLSQLGADFVTGLTGNVPFASEDVVASTSWRTEVAENAESQPTWEDKEMKPKRLSTYLDYSTQMVIQDSMGIENRLRNQLINAAAYSLHLGAIKGVNENSVEIDGILGTAGIGDVSIGTNGGDITWAKVVELETAIAMENADIGALGYLTNARVKGALKTTKKDDGSGIFLMENESLNGYRVGITNLVPGDGTKGTGSYLSTLIFGNFNDLIIGQWGGLDIILDPYTQARKATVRLTLNAFYDVLVLRPESFAAIQDIDTGYET